MNNPTTGEWTAETVTEILSTAFGESDEHGRGLRAIADAHNAALAAEREERAIVERSRDAWQRQVAEHGKTIQQLREQLALAEQMVQIEGKRANEAEMQIAAAVEALEKLHVRIWDKDNCPSIYELRTIIGKRPSDAALAKIEKP